VTKRDRSEPCSAPSQRRGALIVGGAHGSLAVARSLGRRGIPVAFLTDDHPIASFSRYTRRSFPWAGPDRDGAVAELTELATGQGMSGWVLFPGGDAEVRLISQAHAELSRVFLLTTPPWHMAQKAYDKRLLQQQAASVGIDSAWSRIPRDREDLAGIQCSFPAILKPTVRDRRNAFTAAKAWRVDDRPSLLAAYDRAAKLLAAREIMLQEFIPGGGAAQFSYAAVWDRGSPLLSLVARRTRQFPIEFGFTSTFVETIENHQVEDAACRLLRSLNYTGLVEAEFKYDRRDGRYKILDVNLRTWTWCGLGAASGVDFPYAAWQLAVGEVPASGRGRTGIAWRHTVRDVVAGGEEMLRGSLSWADFSRSLRVPKAYAAFAADDPLPGYVDLPLVVTRVLRRLFGHAGDRLSSRRSRPGKDRLILAQGDAVVPSCQPVPDPAAGAAVAAPRDALTFQPYRADDRHRGAPVNPH
jgi:predicted ATP-grasp superfamily ATP-dependent carboligase